jgi:hypothetical protein
MTKPTTNTNIYHDQDITKLRLILRKMESQQKNEQKEVNQPTTIEDLEGNDTTTIYEMTNKWRFTTNEIDIKEAIKQLINIIRKDRNEKEKIRKDKKTKDHRHGLYQQPRQNNTKHNGE